MIGNRPLLQVDATYSKQNAHKTGEGNGSSKDSPLSVTTASGIVMYNGALLDVDSVMQRLERSEKSRTAMESKLKEVQEEMGGYISSVWYTITGPLEKVLDTLTSCVSCIGFIWRALSVMGQGCTFCDRLCIKDKWYQGCDTLVWEMMTMVSMWHSWSGVLPEMFPGRYSERGSLTIKCQPGASRLSVSRTSNVIFFFTRDMCACHLFASIDQNRESIMTTSVVCTEVNWQQEFFNLLTC